MKGKQPYNPWAGINAANSVAQLDGLVKNGKIQRAIQLRELVKILGMPPAPPEAEEMLAGGNITINPGSSSSGAWVFASILAIALIAALLWWAFVWKPAQANPVNPVNPVRPVRPSGDNPDYLDIQVINPGGKL